MVEEKILKKFRLSTLQFLSESAVADLISGMDIGMDIDWYGK